MKNLKEMMMMATFEVFERMFYIFLEPVEEVYKPLDVSAKISFFGSYSGSMNLLLGEELAKDMVQNMLSMKREEITAQDTEDCVKEAVNMICGNFLGRLDKSQPFNMGIPVFSRELPNIFGKNDSHNFYFDSENGAMVVSLVFGVS